MITEVKKFMEQWKMVPQGARVLAGVSGGADSVCLCLLLLELSTEMNFTLEVIHVEHGIRGIESCADAAFVEKLCEDKGIVCHTQRVDVPAYAKEYHLGEEEAARVLRYEAFARIAQQSDGVPVRIALAHHMEDNAETMLFQMIRGSGLDGLCGMRPVRKGAAGEIYIRPFLTVSRAQIEAELAARGQKFCTDSTNADVAYSRNRMRCHVLPELSAINAQAIPHINAAMAQLQQVRDYLEEETCRRKSQVMTREKDAVILSVTQLLDFPKALRMRLIREALKDAAGAAKDLTTAHLEAVERLLDTQSGKWVKLPYQLQARRAYETICITKRMDKTKAFLPVAVSFAGKKEQKELSAGGWKFTFRVFPYDGNLDKIPRKIYTKWFDYDKIKDGLTIRSRRAGDFFVLDAAGHHKKLEDYFVNEKIPAQERDAYPLLARENEIFWIVGGRMASGAGICADTKLVLEISASKDTKGGK